MLRGAWVCDSGLISRVGHMEEERVCHTLQGAGEDYTGTRTLGVSQGVTQSTWAVACTVQGMHVTHENVGTMERAEQGGACGRSSPPWMDLGEY